MVKLLVFGDSITWGAFDTEKGGWVERLKFSLFSTGTELYNCGVSGDSTIDILKRFDTEVIARSGKHNKNKLIFFAVGINDSRFMISTNENFVNIFDFEKNLLLVYKKALKFSNKIIFVGLTKVDETKTIPTPLDTDIEFRNDIILKYNSIIQKICKDNKIKYIPMFDLLEPDDLYDGLHPNATGHNKMFKRVEQFLKEENMI
jgi:lysophospholipase L1-like esterase